MAMGILAYATLEVACNQQLNMKPSVAGGGDNKNPDWHNVHVVSLD